MSLDELEDIQNKLNSIKFNACVQENCDIHTVLLNNECIMKNCSIDIPDVTSILYNNKEQNQINNIWIIFLVFFLLIIILYFIQKTWRNHFMPIIAKY
jgi:hypothetical protein